MKDIDVVIIGAGLAGLSAHHELQKTGLSVLTLEASSIPGGRVRTEEIGGGFSDTGAQFFTRGYPRIMKLLEELGLRAHNSSPLLGYVDARKEFLINSRNPLSPLISGYLSLSEYTRFARGLLPYLKLARTISPESPGDLWGFPGDAGTFCRNHFGDKLTEKIFSPYFSAFNYALPSELSEALAVRALLHFARGDSLVGLPGGLATLPGKLAEGKDIRYNTQVKRISGTRVETSAGDFSARHVIVATTGTVAQRLLGEAFPKNLAVAYKPSVHEAYLVKKKKRSGAYGTLVLPEKNPFVNVLTDESRKAPGLGPRDADLLGVLRTSRGAQEKNIPGVHELLGIESSDILERRETYWEEAIPVLSPGHFMAINSYRKKLLALPEILLAGDYLSTGCAEGAVESGQFVGELLASRL